MEFLVYLFNVSVCISVFYAFYRIALQTTTFYQWNRFYLLISTLVSFCIPLIPALPLLANEVIIPSNTPLLLQNLQGGIDSYQVKILEVSNSFLISYLIISIYSIGLFYLLTKFILGIFQVMRIIRKSKQEKFGNYVLIPTKALPISSFFNYIFLENKHLSTIELEQIIAHECVHVAEKHSFDVLFFHLVSALCWFNPIVFWVEKSVNQLHEYIADSKAVQVSSPAEYARLLLKLSSKTVQYSALNTFSTTLIKSRIMKLNQNQTNKSQKLRFIFAMPMVALLITFFAYLQPLFAQSEKLLVGTWRGADMQMKFNEGAQITKDAYDDMALLMKTLVYTFNADGTFKVTSTHRKGFDEAGTWKISADKKFIAFEVNGKIRQHEIIEVSDKKLITKEIVNSQGAFTRGEFLGTFVKE
jgi:hypothetical protein